MKIEEVINKAVNDVLNKTPDYKDSLTKEYKSINIEDYTPQQLVGYIKEQGIEGGSFSTHDIDEGFIGAYSVAVYVWEESRLLTEGERKVRQERYFNSHLFKTIYTEAEKQGYKRVGVGSHIIRELGVTVNYYTQWFGDESKKQNLIKYFSLVFVKN